MFKEVRNGGFRLFELVQRGETSPRQVWISGNLLYLVPLFKAPSPPSVESGLGFPVSETPESPCSSCQISCTGNCTQFAPAALVARGAGGIQRRSSVELFSSSACSCREARQCPCLRNRGCGLRVSPQIVYGSSLSKISK